MSKPPPLAAGTSLTFSHQGCLRGGLLQARGQPDSNEECLKVGDLYGLRAILFREPLGRLVFRTADRGETRNIN